MVETASQTAKTSKYGLVQIWTRGEKLPRLSRGGRIKQYARQAFRSVSAAPLTFVVSVGTIALAFSLFTGFLLVWENVKGALKSSQSGLSMSLYLKDGASDSSIKRLTNQLKTEALVDTIVLRTREEALRDFKKSLGDQSWVLEGIEQDNPLPISLEVGFKSTPQALDAVRSLANQYGRQEVVEHVEYSQLLLNQLFSLLGAVRLAAAFLMLLILTMVVFLVANTIKLALYAHRDEIEIMHLVGATNNFVRIPYAIEGGAQGFLGGLLSLTLMYGIYSMARNLISSSEVLLLFLPHFQFIPEFTCLLVLVLSTAVGVLGSYVTVRSFGRTGTIGI